MESKIEHIKTKFNHDKKSFNVKILKQGRKKEEDKIEELNLLYNEYRKRLSSLVQMSLTVKMDKDDMLTYRNLFKKEFQDRARKLVSDEVALCNMLVDICYKSSNTTKQFVWDICRKQLIENLLLNKR